MLASVGKYVTSPLGGIRGAEKLKIIAEKSEKKLEGEKTSATFGPLFGLL